MEVRNAILRRRSIRRFTQQPVSPEMLTELVSLARLYASGANLQPIRFLGITEEPLRSKVFSLLRWAAYLPGYEILPENRPTAYLVLTCEASKKNSCRFDLGAASTTLMLAAEGEGIGTCCLASFDREKLMALLNIPEDTEPLLVIALGYPAQESRAVPYDGSIKYYEEAPNHLCVPKFSTEEVLTIL